jgi:hypothetical protein
MGDNLRQRLGLLLPLLLLAFEACAYVDPPTFSPAAPTSNDVVVMTFRTGYCHAFADEGYRPPEIVVNDGFIDVTILGEALSGGHCIYPPIIESSYTIGRFPAGSYSVRLFRRHLGPPSHNFVDPFPYFVAPLAVMQAPPTAIAATGSRGNLLLMFGIAGFALLRAKALFQTLRPIRSTLPAIGAWSSRSFF